MSPVAAAMCWGAVGWPVVVISQVSQLMVMVLAMVGVLGDADWFGGVEVECPVNPELGVWVFRVGEDVEALELVGFSAFGDGVEDLGEVGVDVGVLGDEDWGCGVDLHRVGHFDGEYLWLVAFPSPVCFWRFCGVEQFDLGEVESHGLVLSCPGGVMRVVCFLPSGCRAGPLPGGDRLRLRGGLCRRGMLVFRPRFPG